MLTTTVDGLWVLQAVTGVEQTCPELGLRPLLPRLDTAERALRHPVAAELMAVGALDQAGNADPMVREWLTVLLRRDLGLLVTIGVPGGEPTRAAICRFATWWVVLERHGNMLDDGAIGRGDPSVRHHFRDSVSDTMRITDLAAPRKIPPGTGWRKFVYSVSFHKINPGESPRERHYRNLQGRIRRHIRRQYVITVVSGKGGVGVTTMAACIGGVFRECRPENVIAIDAVPSFGTLADRIDESPPGDYAAIINDTDVQGYADIREHLGQNTVGLDVLAGNRTSDQPRPLVPAMFSAVLSRLRRTHTVIVIDTSPDLEHDVMKAVLQSTDTLVFVSGITADRSRPVLRAVDYLRAQGYHELVSRSTVILNHTDSITDKDALAYLTERFTKVGAIVEAMPFDPHLAKGGIIDTVHELNKKSRLRLFEITAGLADKYVPDAERAAQ